MEKLVDKHDMTLLLEANWMEFSTIQEIRAGTRTIRNGCRGLTWYMDVRTYNIAKCAVPDPEPTNIFATLGCVAALPFTSKSAC